MWSDMEPESDTDSYELVGFLCFSFSFVLASPFVGVSFSTFSLSSSILISLLVTSSNSSSSFIRLADSLPLLSVLVLDLNAESEPVDVDLGESSLELLLLALFSSWFDWVLLLFSDDEEDNEDRDEVGDDVGFWIDVVWLE